MNHEPPQTLRQVVGTLKLTLFGIILLLRGSSSFYLFTTSIQFFACVNDPLIDPRVPSLWIVILV